MRLRFHKDCRLLEVLNCSELEIKQLNTTCSVSWVSFKGRKRKTNTRNFFENYTYIPGGFWKKILSLRDKGYTVNIENINELTQNNVGSLDEFTQWCESLNTAFDPYDYQVKGAFLALKYRISRGEYCTGAGKTFITYLITRYLLDNILPSDKKVLIVVPSLMLVNQLENDFNEDYHLDEHLPIDKVYGGSKRDKSARIVCGNIDSLANYDSDFFEQFGAVLFDESHKLKTSSYKQIYSMLIPNKMSLIWSCSGTFYPEKSIEDYTASSISGPMLISVGYDVLANKYKSITPVKIDMHRLMYSQDVCHQYYHHPKSISSTTRNHFENKFIKSQVSRFKYITNIVTSTTNSNQLMLFKYKHYLDVMKRYLEKVAVDHKILVIHGDIDLDKREEIKQFTEANVNVIILATYPTMSTGVSIKNLGTLHLVESAKSFIRVRQSIGRALRLHPSKEFAQVHDYVDIFKRFDPDWPGRKSGNIASSHASARQRIYKRQKMPFVKKTVQM